MYDDRESHSASLPKAVDQQSPLLKLEAKIIREHLGDKKLFDKHFGICAELLQSKTRTRSIGSSPTNG